MPGSIFDDELVAPGERDDRPVQDFAAVTWAVFTAILPTRLGCASRPSTSWQAGGDDARALPWEQGSAASSRSAGYRPDEADRFPASHRLNDASAGRLAQTHPGASAVTVTGLPDSVPDGPCAVTHGG